MACRLDDGTQGITERDHTLLYQYQRAPRIEIIIQPKSKILRWRYQSEGNTAGSLVGDNSTPDNITYPTIEIKNYCGPAELVISLVSNDNPPCPHYCSLVGKDCQEDGTCVLRIPAGQQVISCQGIGVRCERKKDKTQAFEKKKLNPRQAYRDELSRQSPEKIDSKCVRLCFQLFLPDSENSFTVALNPVLSQSIMDKKGNGSLKIVRIDKASGKASGGDEIYMLVDKVQKEDIAVHFMDGDWKAEGVFGQGDIHRQYAIVFKTPSYRNPNILHQVVVDIKLYRPSTGEYSEAIKFTYEPIVIDGEGIQAKKRKTVYFNQYIPMDGNVTELPEFQGGFIEPGELNVKEKLRETIEERNGAKRQCTTNQIVQPTGLMVPTTIPQMESGNLQPTFKLPFKPKSREIFAGQFQQVHNSPSQIMKAQLETPGPIQLPTRNSPSMMTPSYKADIMTCSSVHTTQSQHNSEIHRPIEDKSREQKEKEFEQQAQSLFKELFPTVEDEKKTNIENPCDDYGLVTEDLPKYLGTSEEFHLNGGKQVNLTQPLNSAMSHPFVNQPQVLSSTMQAQLQGPSRAIPQPQSLHGCEMTEACFTDYGEIIHPDAAQENLSQTVSTLNGSSFLNMVEGSNQWMNQGSVTMPDNLNQAISNSPSTYMEGDTPRQGHSNLNQAISNSPSTYMEGDTPRQGHSNLNQAISNFPSTYMEGNTPRQGHSNLNQAISNSPSTYMEGDTPRQGHSNLNQAISNSPSTYMEGDTPRQGHSNLNQAISNSPSTYMEGDTPRQGHGLSS